MHPHIIQFGASKVVNFLSRPCKRLVSPFCTLSRQPQGRIHEDSECAAVLPVLPRPSWRSTAEGDGGFCHGLRGEFQVHVARGLTGKPRMGMGRQSRRLRLTQILLLFQSRDGGHQGFVATRDDTLQLGFALLDHSLQFSRLGMTSEPNSPICTE
jgi:hypothetical protein